MKTFRRIQTSDLDLMKVQNAVEQTLNPIAKLPLLDGTFLTGVDLIAVPADGLKVPHNLSRQPLGWFLVDQTANAVIFRMDWTATTITLQTSADCTVSIWIF